MAYKAPDPEQFAEMEQAYSIMAPTAAMLITMPTFVFPGETTALSRIIFMNQCNPGSIMKAGAHWLVLAEKYLEAADKLKEKRDEFNDEDWEGDDRDAFDDKSEKVHSQLTIIAAFAMHVGITLFTIGTMLAVMVPLMLAVATSLQAFAVLYLINRAIPFPPAQVVANNIMVAAQQVAGRSKDALTALDTAIEKVGHALAAFINGNMAYTWVALAAKGNVVNPGDTIGASMFSLMQGLAQMTLRNLMAPGRAGNPGLLDKISPKANNWMAGKEGWFAGFSGAQGAYNLGNSADGIANPDKEDNAMAESGVDVMGLDFVPNNHGFEDSAMESEKPPDIFMGEDQKQDYE